MTLTTSQRAMETFASDLGKTGGQYELEGQRINVTDIVPKIIFVK